jgi:TIR domain
MTTARWAAAIAVGGLLAAALLPVSEAVDAGQILRARLLTAVLVAAAAAGAALARSGRRALWMATAAVAGLSGAVLVVRHVSASSACVASYDGRPVLVGRELTQAARDYVTEHPGASADDLLLDAGGAADRIWTASSIASCGFWTGWAGLLSLPLFAGAVSALVASRGLRLGPAAEPPPARARAANDPPRPVYDAFLSYRHVEPDKTRADDLLEALESRGFRVAIDVRDFVPNQHFLAEMERCIKESRFVLCVISPRYLDSDHCAEEAVISKTLDMSERTRRIVPLVFERVELPVWLHGLVGIDFTEQARVEPIERLVTLLARPGAPAHIAR